MANKALVHRPSTTLMTPKGAIDNTVPINFSFTFDGYICKTVHLVFYTGLGIEPSLTQEYAVTGYNGSRITVTLPANTLTSDATSYYGIDVGGENRTATVTTGSKIINILNHGLNTGDEVSINNGTANAFKAEQYVNVLSSSMLLVYPTRELALIGGEDKAITLVDGQILRPWGRSDRIAIKLATRNLNLSFDTTEITSQKYTLVPSYTKPPEGNLVVRFRCYIYDIAGNLVNDSGDIFNGNIQYTFSGFLTNTVYQIRFTAVDEYNYLYDTGRVSVAVNFEVPVIEIKPTAENLCFESCVRLNWSQIFQIVGDITGEVDYIDNWIIEENTAILLQPNATLSYEIPIPKDSPPIWIWASNGAGYNGIVVQMENKDTGDVAYLTYNDTNEGWFISINGRSTLMKREKVKPTSIYLIGFYEATAVINEIVDLDLQHNTLNFELSKKKNIL